MKRRDFLKGGLATGAITTYGAHGMDALGALTPSDPAATKRVLVIFKCHLDLGFIDTQANVIRKYFDVYYPQALKVTEEMRASGEDRYVWTTGSWLLYEYLEQAQPEQRRLMEKAVASGDIAWHALPFTWQTEIMDRSLIAGSLGLSQTLDRRFGHTTTGAKMTDVPGHSRGIIAPLAEHGVKLLDIGVNHASTGPEVPPLFLWKDKSGASLVMLYHRHGYGGVVQVPGTDLAIDVEVRGDNSGPHTIEEIRQIYARLREQFPNAKITAASLTDVANAVQPYRDTLPVVTQEIGDTWIYGVPSDPVKMAQYLELTRLRKEQIAAGRFRTGDATDIRILRSLLLATEHTWGTDTKTWMDFDHYTPHDLAEMLDTPKYKVVTHSWEEKRDDLAQAVASMPDEMRTEAQRRLDGLRPVEPGTASMKPHEPGEPIESRHFKVGLDPRTGAIHLLQHKPSGREWASAANPLALFSYQTLSKADYDVFHANYLKIAELWAFQDFGKPNIDHFGAKSQTWTPTLTSSWLERTPAGLRLLSLLNIHDAEAEREGRVAWPHRMYLEILLPDREPLVEINFSWFDKVSNRMPEALWLSFLPAAQQEKGWSMEKVEQQVSPFDVVSSGNRHMHALSGAIAYKDERGGLSIESADAPVIALGERSPIGFSNQQPVLSKGVHYSLYNNAWGTNYIQWFGENMRFRFRIRA
ncbi:MAG TPA: DUF5054 domain-containing protein [Acidisarcina sp.]|nr:DUF5054 domain-containing protein [Acidisarcina sp.]